MAGMGKGYWLDPDDNAMYSVDKFRDRHEWWLLDADNQNKVNLRPQTKQVLADLKAKAEGPGAVPADEIRVIGVKAGLVRIRDFRNNIVVQFHASRSRVRNVLWSIFLGMDKAMKPSRLSQIDIHNLSGNDTARVTWSEFQKKLVDDVSILRETVEPRTGVKDIPFDPKLNEAVDKLLGDGPLRNNKSLPESMKIEKYKGDYEAVGYRFISKHDVKKTPKVGDFLASSSVWVGDEPTEKFLPGTSSFSRWSDFMSYAKYSKNGGWVVIIGGSNKGRGDEAGELLIGRAKILELANW